MDFLKSLVTENKTYKAVVGLILTQVALVFTGEQEWVDIISWLFLGGGIAGIRAKLGRNSQGDE